MQRAQIPREILISKMNEHLAELGNVQIRVTGVDRHDILVPNWRISSWSGDEVERLHDSAHQSALTMRLQNTFSAFDVSD